MRVLFLSPRQCWPPTTGAKLREYHLARQLKTRVELTVLAFSKESMADAPPFCHDLVTVPPPEKYTVWKLIRGAVGRTPVSVLNYTTEAMRRSLADLLEPRQFDIVQIEGTQMAGYADVIQASPQAPAVVYDWHNIESELMLGYAAHAGNWSKRFYARLTADRLNLLEEAMLRTGAAHLVCSPREKEKLIGIAPEASVVVVANGVDVGHFSNPEKSSVPEGGRIRLVFVGSMDYHANIEAAIHFARNVWPRIVEDFPHLRLTLVGSKPAAEVRSLASLPGVEVTGTVPDVRPYYAQSVAAIVPLGTGGGTRLKILEAMAAGVPVISTAIGAEGLDLTPGEDILLAETELEWRKAIRRVLMEAGAAEKLAINGRERVRRSYDWKIPGDILFGTYEKLLAMRSRS
jgi:polysaccharide biosynthesis protein PslH